MVAILHKDGHQDGHMPIREWWSFCAEGDRVHEEFEEAWARFQREFSKDVWDEVDEKLCLAIETAITSLDQLVARFPDEERLIDF